MVKKKKFIVVLTVDVESEEDNTPEGIKETIDGGFGHDVVVDSVIETEFDGDTQLLNVRIMGAVVEKDDSNEKVLAFDNRTIVITSRDIEEEEV